MAFVAVTLVPFFPLAVLTWWTYRSELVHIEAEIQAANRHIAGLAAGYLGLLVEETRQDVARLAVTPTPKVPSDRPEVLWEWLDDDCTVIASQIDSSRIGTTCDCEELLAGLAPGEPRLSSVRRWIAGGEPTVIVAARRSGGGGIVALFVPSALHADLQSWASSETDRRVYSVDADGRLLFYSDLDVSRRGEDLSDNPPIEMLLAEREGAVRYRSVVTGKERLAVVQQMQSTGWGVIVSADVGDRMIGLRSRSRALGVSILFALAAALAILLAASRRVVEPLLDVVRALRAPERAPHAPLVVSDRVRRLVEIDDLVRAYDELASEVEATERELVHAERSALLGQLASGLAHEMGTPLNVITGTAQYLGRRIDADDPMHQELERIERQARRIAGMIHRLLDLSRPAPARLMPFDAAAVVRQTLDTVRGSARGVEFEEAVDPDAPPILADPRLLEHALLNLVVNACDATPAGGQVTVRVASVPERRGASGPWVRISVADTGHGMAPDELLRATEPFFTTKPQGHGTGLGLAIVDRIMRQLGGLLELESRQGEGTTASLWLRPAIGRQGEP